MGKVTIVVEDSTISTDELYKACQKATDTEDFNRALPTEAEVYIVKSDKEISDGMLD